MDGTRFAGRVRIFFGALDHCVGRSAVATTSDAPNGGSGLFVIARGRDVALVRGLRVEVGGAKR